MTNAWILLLLAITAEVIGTSCLRLSVGMTKTWPTIFVLLAYTLAVWLLSKVVLILPLGITYAPMEWDRHHRDRAGWLACL